MSIISTIDFLRISLSFSSSNLLGICPVTPSEVATLEITSFRGALL